MASRRRAASCGVAALLLIGAGLIEVGASTTAQSPAASPHASKKAMRPLVDYHTHLNSLAYSENNTPPIIKATSLPADLAELLARRTANADADQIVKLFTEDALFLDVSAPNWARGRDKIQLFLSLMPPGYDFVPVEYSKGQEAGFVTGYVTRGEGASRSYRRTFHLGLRKESGSWKIAAESWSERAPPVPREVSAANLISEMDAGGVKKAIVLSPAFVFGSVLGAAADERDKVRAENDWIAAQAARYPDRLVPFCSFNPVKAYALDELRRCAAIPNVKGLKFHFSDSGVDLRKPDVLERMRAVFREANKSRLAIVAHIATLDPSYDPATQASLFLGELLAAAPDVPVQIAHMTGDTGYTPQSEASFRVFADAVKAKDPRTRNLFFDAAGVVTPAGQSAEDLQVIASRIREVGPSRILFASDRHDPRNPPPGDAWEHFRKLPLTDPEFQQIAANLLPFAR